MSKKLVNELFYSKARWVTDRSEQHALRLIDEGYKVFRGATLFGLTIDPKDEIELHKDLYMLHSTSQAILEGHIS